MIPALREAFNRNFTPEKYQQFLERSRRERAARPLAFASPRLPALFPKRCSTRWRSMAATWFCSWSTIPSTARFRTSPSLRNTTCRTSRRCRCSCRSTSAWCATDGRARAQAGRVAGLPFSLRLPAGAGTAVHRVVTDCREDLGIYLGGYDHDSYRQLMRELIVGGHDPENVILMEIDPENQKTLPRLSDHAARTRHRDRRHSQAEETRQEALLRERRPRDRSAPHLQPLHRRRAGAQRTSRCPSILREQLDVEWAGHPNWYFRISKFSIPYLKHQCVPKTWFLDQNQSCPATTRTTC